MVEAAAGRRSGTCRRRPSGGGELQRQQLLHQRLVAMATAAGAAGPGGGVSGGGGRCLGDFVDCLLGVLGALGLTGVAARPPQGQPRPPPSRGAAAADARRLAAELRGVPGRIAGNGASAVASLYTLQGRKGVNQDAMIFWENFCSSDGTIFCGVFDGHGPYGHLVAKRVRDLLPVKLRADLGMDADRETSMSNIKSNANEVGSPEHIDRGDTTISTEAEQNGKYPESFPALRAALLKAFRIMDRDLKIHKNIDCFFSGTTAVAMIKQGHNLIIGNLGDSRAVLGTRNENNQLVAVQLTVDLKPNIPSGLFRVKLSDTKTKRTSMVHLDYIMTKCYFIPVCEEGFLPPIIGPATGEAQRIRQRKGRIFALPEEPEVARVWLPKYNSPGLAMARAFGDFCLKDHGLISMPDVSYHHITEKDEFVVLATDGVWDVLSNDEVVSIVSQATSRASAARFLVESAHRAWRNRFPTSKIDDCAVVCLFLNTDEESESSSSMANNLVNSVEVTSNQPSATFQLNTESSANIVTAMVTNGNEPSVVDAIAKPVAHAKDI